MEWGKDWGEEGERERERDGFTTPSARFWLHKLWPVCSSICSDTLVQMVTGSEPAEPCWLFSDPETDFDNDLDRILDWNVVWDPESKPTLLTIGLQCCCSYVLCFFCPFFLLYLSSSVLLPFCSSVLSFHGDEATCAFCKETIILILSFYSFGNYSQDFWAC